MEKKYIEKALGMFSDSDIAYKKIEYNYFYLISATVYSPAKHYEKWTLSKEKNIDIVKSFNLAITDANSRNSNEKKFEFIGEKSEIAYVLLLSSVKELKRIEISRLFGSVSKELFNKYKFKDLLVLDENKKNRLFDLKIKKVSKNLDFIEDM